MMQDIRDHGPHVLPFNNGAPLRKEYIGLIDFVDHQLAVMTLFFFNVVDGSHPHAALQAFQFVGQVVAGWGLLVLEASRGGNRWRAVSL